MRINRKSVIRKLSIRKVDKAEQAASSARAAHLSTAGRAQPYAIAGGGGGSTSTQGLTCAYDSRIVPSGEQR